MTPTPAWPHWRKVRIILCILGGAGAAGTPVDTFLKTTWTEALLMFPAATLMVLFVVGFQAFNPFSAPEWHRPAWASNPFNFSDPLSFFHLGGWYFLASGLGVLIPALRTGLEALIAPATLTCVGAGTLVGVRLCEVVWTRKFGAANAQGRSPHT